MDAGEEHAEGDACADWYEDSVGHPEVAGVYGFENMNNFGRARKAATPMSGPTSGLKVPQGTAGDHESPDLISAAKKVAQVAAEQTIAAASLSQHTRAYEKLTAPAFPKGFRHDLPWGSDIVH